MFENLSDKLQRSFKTLRGQGTITDENIGEALREIRLALIEADVSLSRRHRARRPHPRPRARRPGCHRALALRADRQNRPRRAHQHPRPRHRPLQDLLAAAQRHPHGRPAGSGKTTTSGKLAMWLKKSGHRPMLVSVDVYRPAAREQLAIVARSTGSQIYEGKLDPAAKHGTDDVLRLAREAKREAASFGCDILIVDTAGRNQIDADLMDEMAALKKLLNPSEILFVADAMTGQDAVKSAKAFHDLLALTGVILTKMDGDARGGAALSIRHVTGAPIKFLGTGEKPDAFEPFHPDRIVSRIMGMGDIATLLERAEEKLDRGKAEQFAKKALSGDGFSLEDFREQLRQIKKDGLHEVHPQDAPSVGPFAGMQQAVENVDEGQFNRVETIIDSMTAKERPTTRSSTAAAANASPAAPAPPSRTSTTSSASTPRCAKCSKPWAVAEASKPSKE
jgi:signal recognition particle subunit SRP54